MEFIDDAIDFYAGTEMLILFIDAFIISHKKSFAIIVPHFEILAKVGVNRLKLNTFRVENLEFSNAIVVKTYEENALKSIGINDNCDHTLRI